MSGLVIHVIAERLVDLTPRLALLTRPETSDEAEPESKRLATAEATELQRTYPSRDFH